MRFPFSFGAKAKPVQKSALPNVDPTEGTAGSLVQTNEPGAFYIDLRPRLITIPDKLKKEDVNIRYPLIVPYAFAHLYWNPELNEIVYDVEEPLLDDTEKELLRLIQLPPPPKKEI